MLVAGLLVFGCSSAAEPEQQPPAEGDVGQQTDGATPTPDVVEEVQTPPELPTATGFAATAGSAESSGYRLRFSLSAPLRAGPAQSENYQMNAIISMGASESGAEE